MKLNLRAEFQDGTELTFVTRIADLAEWERLNSRTVASWADGVGIRDLAQLAWLVAKREKHTAAKFEEFLETLEAVEVVADENPKAGRRKA